MSSLRSFLNRSSKAPSGSLADGTSADNQTQGTTNSGTWRSFRSALSRRTGNTDTHKPDIQLTTKTEKQYDDFRLRWRSNDEMSLPGLQAIAKLGNELGELKAQMHTDSASKEARSANASALQQLDTNKVEDQAIWRNLVENLGEELDLEAGYWKKQE